MLTERFLTGCSMSVNVSPYVLFRRNRIPVSEVACINFGDSWSGIDGANILRAEAEKFADSLSSLLAGIVPETEKPVRSKIVQLRRDVHNGRHERVVSRASELRPYLGERIFGEIQDWVEASEGAYHREKEAREAFAREQEEARAAFTSLFGYEAIGKSIQLSGGQLYQSLLNYVEQGPGAFKPSKVRNFESTLVNYVYRASLKPSPFGWFTEVGAFPADLGQGNRADGEDEGTGSPVGPAAAATVADGDASVAKLNVFLMNWIVGALTGVPGGWGVGVFLLNPTVRVDGEQIEFSGTSNESFLQGRIHGEMVRIKRDRVVECLLELLSGGPRAAADVAGALADATGDEGYARRILTALMRVGLVFFRVDIDDQDAEYSRKFEELLREGGTPQLARLADEFSALREVEAGLPGATIPEREALLLSAQRSVSAIAEACGTTLPPEVMMRSPVYEDVPTRTRPRTWSPETVTGGLDALEGLWRFSSLLEQGQTKRLALYAFAVQSFGDREDIPFLDYFAAFARLPNQEQWALLAGRGGDLTDLFLEQRDAALREIRRKTVLEGDVLRLDPSELLAACASVEDLRDPASITFRLQFSSDGGTRSRRQPVVNGVFTGFGAFYSRFSDFVPGTNDDWSLRSSLRRHIGRTFPDQTDLHAVLGFNFNLHPPLTDRSVLYPGSVASGGSQEFLGLDGLRLRVDHESRSLLLWDPLQDRRVDLLPMNFLLPVNAPLLYQVLDALSPTVFSTWQPVNDMRNCGYFESLPESFHRLEVGDVVADRRTWTVPAEDVPGLEDLSRDSYEALLRFDEWRRARGLPRHAFVMCRTLDEFNTLTGRMTDMSKVWGELANLNRASVHKPMYVDFRNPYLVRSFARSATSRSGVFVSVTECLPAVEDYADDPDITATEEFFVELYRDRH